MNQIDARKIEEFVCENIQKFHASKLNILKKLKLKGILRSKNPYLFKAKNMEVAAELVTEILNAFCSSSEEKIFGDFLEDLALFIVGFTYNGAKSPASGIDFQFTGDDGTINLVSVKSGPNWGNSSQQRKLDEDFNRAVKVIRQREIKRNIKAILGICYGRAKTAQTRNHIKVVGQNFWYLISGNKDLYTDIIEPLGHEAKRHNDDFLIQRAQIINSFTEEFLLEFCNKGKIDWKKIVEFNSGNFDLE
jgi:hypothetical protein